MTVPKGWEFPLTCSRNVKVGGGQSTYVHMKSLILWPQSVLEG